MSNKKSAREKIIEIRSKLKMSQPKIANILGVSRDIVASWEIGRTRVPGDMLSKAEQLLEQYNHETPCGYDSKYIENLEYIKEIQQIMIKELELKIHDMKNSITNLQSENNRFRTLLSEMRESKRNEDPEDFDPSKAGRSIQKIATN